VATACQVRDQDIGVADTRTAALRRGMARDRRISMENPDMRHGRTSRTTLCDGYQRCVRRDLDTGLIPAVGLTPAKPLEAGKTVRRQAPPWPLPANTRCGTGEHALPERRTRGG
jgi:hypothetical protein